MNLMNKETKIKHERQAAIMTSASDEKAYSRYDQYGDNPISQIKQEVLGCMERILSLAVSSIDSL